MNDNYITETGNLDIPDADKLSIEQNWKSKVAAVEEFNRLKNNPPKHTARIKHFTKQVSAQLAVIGPRAMLHLEFLTGSIGVKFAPKPPDYQKLETNDVLLVVQAAIALDMASLNIYLENDIFVPSEDVERLQEAVMFMENGVVADG